MQSNRELLEAAAKAGGIEGEYVSWCLDGFKEGIRKAGDTTSIPWNPLTGDGDALRLAVKCGIEFTPFNASKVSRARVLSSEDGEMRENYKDDAYAASRRVIVRAAAEIGKAMA